MLLGEIWNTLEIRYLYDYISMKKILELNICKEVCRRWTHGKTI
jgi:hypothetical protein